MLDGYYLYGFRIVVFPVHVDSMLQFISFEQAIAT